MSNTANSHTDQNIDEEIRDLVIEKGITRLCHFTQSRNLAHIFGDGLGICSTYELKKEKLPYNETDEVRYDRHPELICCSIEFPNVYYFATSRSRVQLFEDWAVLLIDPKYIYHKDTLYCPCNAAKGKGAYLCSGAEGFESLYDLHPRGSNFPRSAKRMEAAPTDVQAEVLVDGPIALEDIIGVVFFDIEQARRELLRLELMQAKLPERCKVYISQDFYDKENLDTKIRNNRSVEILELLSNGSTKIATFAPNHASDKDHGAQDNAADDVRSAETSSQNSTSQTTIEHDSSSSISRYEVLKRIKDGLNEGCIVYNILNKNPSYALDKDQTDALFLPSRGINLIRGSNGTGKTALSILRAIYLSCADVNDNAGKTLVITRNLQFMSLVENSLTNESLSNIDIKSLRLFEGDDVKAHVAHQRGVSLERIKNTPLMCTGKTRTNMMNSAIDEVKSDYSDFALLDVLSICFDEFKVIVTEGIIDSDEYIKHIQLRRVKPHELLDVEVDKDSFYEFIFKIAVVYERLIKESKYAYDSYSVHNLWSELPASFKSCSEYQHIIIDDASQIPSCVIKALSKSIAPGGSLTLFVDKYRFGSYPLYIESQDFLSGAKSVDLFINYRSQLLIQSLALKLAKANGQNLDERYLYFNQYAKIKPLLICADSKSDEEARIINAASNYKSTKSTAFLVSNSSQVTILSKILPDAIKIKELSNFEIKIRNGVYIGVMLESKGLTFDVVYMPFMSVDAFDSLFNEEADLEAARSIYSGINCASERLRVMYTGTMTKHLECVLDKFER